MAYKSLLLSFCLTALLGYALTVGLTNPNSFVKKLPDWTAIPMLAGIFILYLLAAWWAFKDFGEHKVAALSSLGLPCVRPWPIRIGLCHGNRQS